MDSFEKKILENVNNSGIEECKKEFRDSEVRNCELEACRLTECLFENDNLIININEIQPNEVIIISYNVIIINNPSLITTKTSITSKETQAKEINSLSLKEGFAEIECIKTVSDEITFLNTDLTYILKLNNKGNINAYNIEVFDELPVTFELDNYNPISINNSPIDYVLDNNILKLTIPLIEANSSLNIKINGQITK